MAIAASVSLGVVGCSHPTTPSRSSSAGEAISSASAQPLVDVSAVWATHPMPDCPRVVIGNESAPAGLTLPSAEGVAKELAGVRSPASEGWVRTKLGWVTRHLAKTRADIIDANTPGDDSMLKTFDLYVKHVRTELVAGQGSSDPTDEIYPEGC
ncbi:hypothetical protein [Mycobacteroides abscessus]|uniref:hypothetical protein n=1 Tax=Mycobacteroides abscessus TaxID=36809 RepID=UPI0019D11401|nr:hypothetical protein [Mycobacteroides abscessus]MBN7483686.1 hypothetical protein [Mycobacteroides abscessus subsp. massiliense]